MPPNAESGQGLHCLLKDISMENTVQMNNPAKNIFTKENNFLAGLFNC